ncbi:MAG: MotA/TolQ/ExbB proton channel family protein, partial [Verrucomicrobiota bacterium]
LLIGMLAAFLAVVKCFGICRLRAPRETLLGQAACDLQAGRVEDARTLLQGLRSPFRDVLSATIDYRDAQPEYLEEILQERALAARPALERHLGLLAVLGGVAPLLGLLGTVTGMIHTFDMVTLFGTGDAKLLSGGISEALVTTETGLVIAVPVLIVHAMLARRVRNVVSALEQTALHFLNRLRKETA